MQFVFIHRWIIRNVATPKCFLPTGTTHEYSGWNVGERGERRGKEVRWLQPRRRSRPSRIAVTCWTIRPRSPSNRREATVRSRLLHLLPPSNPPRGEEGTRSKRPRSTADTQRSRHSKRERRYQRYTRCIRAGIRLTRVSTPTQA